jgi:serine/threonine protein kinase
LPIGTRLGTYQVTGIVHRDLSGIVYAGEDRSSPGKVAIKEYLPATLSDRMASGKVGLRSLRYKPSFQEGKERFLSNGRMLAALDEPALIRVLRCWKQNGTAYMAMPLYEGQTLDEVLRLSDRPSEAWLKSMLGPLLDAFATLHRFDCYPCNVTPDNIVMLQDGTPLLFAFGAGRRTTHSGSGDLRHDLNPGFAPIEQYAHDPTMPEGPWTDVYAVAAVIRFAITGKHLPALAARMASDTLPSLRESHSDYSAVFLDAIDRGVAVLPRDRPQTIAEFRRSLGIHQLGSGGAPTPLQDARVAPNTHRWTTKFSSDLSPESEVAVPEGTATAAPGVEQIVLPPLSPELETPARDGTSQPAMQSSPGGLPWKLVLQVFVVGLFALGLLVWNIVERRQAPPATADHVLQPVANTPQATLPVAASPAPAERVAPPVVASPSRTESVAPVMTSSSIAEAAAPVRPEPSVATVTAVPSVPTAATQPPPAPRAGKVRFSIRPWGEIFIDGKSRGVSPPLKELSIPEGRHRIQIRNGTFPGYDSELDIKSGSKDEIAYSFKAP